MRQERIGIYQIGGINVELFAVDHADGGEFWFAPDEVSLPRIKVGIFADWWVIVSTLVHEAFELQAEIFGCRWERASPFTGGSDGRLFVLTHDEFSVACEKIGPFLAKAMPDLAMRYEPLREKWKEAEGEVQEVQEGETGSSAPDGALQAVPEGAA